MVGKIWLDWSCRSEKWDPVSLILLSLIMPLRLHLLVLGCQLTCSKASHMTYMGRVK